MTAEEELVKAQKLRGDLEQQVREELKTDNDNPVNPATITAVKQKFGLVASLADIVRDMKGLNQ